jgi:hypothetical protein
MKGILAALPMVLRDLAGLSGAVLVAYGAFLVYPPAGYIVGGVMLLAASLFLARAE